VGEILAPARLATGLEPITLDSEPRAAASADVSKPNTIKT